MPVTTSFPSNYSHDSEHSLCVNPTLSFLISTFFNVTRLSLLLPLSIFILYLGYKQQQSHSSLQTKSHSDVFTHHLAAMELISSLGTALVYCGFYLKLPHMVTVGYFLSTMIFCGESSFHVLTCVERYLAVVHPITYRMLRNSRGTRIRNICIGFAWILCFVWSSITLAQDPATPVIPLFCILVFSLAVTSYCSLRVLCALVHPGPGEASGDRRQANQSKQRVFFTIMAIMGALCLMFLGSIITTTVYQSEVVSDRVKCLVLVSGYWVNIPSCLVLPLLYLQRRGKLSCKFSSG